MKRTQPAITILSKRPAGEGWSRACSEIARPKAEAGPSVMSFVERLAGESTARGKAAELSA